MFVPHGASSIANPPSTVVVTLASGGSETSELHESHATPGVNGFTPYVGGPTAPFGMYTSATEDRIRCPERRDPEAWPGAVTMPVIRVLGCAGHASRCWQSPVHGGTAHWFGTPAPPHTSAPTHVPQRIRAPHPSETRPHVAPTSAQVRGVHGRSPHWNGVPLPPPQTCPAGHVPQSVWTSPQPSPIGPQVAPTEAHVTFPHETAASGSYVGSGG